MVELKPKLEYYIRHMEEADIPQALEIDREAFPTQWPYPTYSSFKQELRNRIARYIVAVRPVETASPVETAVDTEANGKSRDPFAFLKKLFHHEKTGTTVAPLPHQLVIGFAGFWMMMREAHITTIGVRDKFQRLGIGEQLLFTMIDSAVELNAEVLTLEVRVSNVKAQRLYRKLGFLDAGLRRNYYTDNSEDAMIMTTEKLDNETFRAHLDRMKRAHLHKWGI